MAEFLRLPNFKGCKVAAGALLPPGSARVTHLANPAERLKDIPPKTGDMVTAEIPCRKVLDDKERKKRKAEAKVAANVAGVDIQAERVAGNKDAGKEGTSRKKRRVCLEAPVKPNSEHVSSPTPLNHAHPLETLADKEHASPHASADRMSFLQNQTDEHATPPSVVNANELVIGEEGGGGQENVDHAFANEGHGDNEGGLSRLQTQPSHIRHSGQHLETVEKPACDKVVPNVVSYSAGRFGNLPFTPQWGLTNSCHMDNSRVCRDMMSNLFTLADHEFFNEGVRDEPAIKRSWKLLCQSAQQQANTLLRFKALTEEHANLVYAHKSWKDVKAHYKECKKELVKERLEELEEEKKESEQLNTEQADRIKQLKEALRQSEADAHQLRLDRERYAIEAGNGEMVRRRIINKYLPTFVRRLHQSIEYKRSLGEAFSLAIGKGFTYGISISRKDPNIQAILKATPNVDPASSDIFMETYEKLLLRVSIM
ncbi:hypothetical protein Tco_1079854 [Tanacetum coccineum]|uniref:Uncharacterized protein n=1 Tax=Tanacetum coccineum TaxID=301880 RepID=A0ABQ5HTY2_9ASTR